MLKKVKYFWPEIIIFSFALITRFWRLWLPPSYYFDEVYHAFTAEQMFKGNPAAWEWWNTPPPGLAYEWTHPPLAKEFMWLSMSIFGDNAFAWRFFSAVFGTGIIVLIYFITLHLFKSRRIAILSSLIASLSGLLLVMSRIAMNDSYFLFFSLLALLVFLKNKNLLMGIALGLALASKWSALFTIGILFILFLTQNYKRFNLFKILELILFWPSFLFNDFKIFKFLFSLIIIPVIIYLSSYAPFFLGHHSPPGQNISNFQTFVELQQQMYWYHTNLKATHPYQSTPYDWIFDLRPVWLFVDYPQSVEVVTTYSSPIPAPSPTYIVQQGDTLWDIAQIKLGSGFKWEELKGYSGEPEQLPVGTKIELPNLSQFTEPSVPTKSIIKKNSNLVANIYTLDNPLIPWFGLISILFLTAQLFKKFVFPNFLVVLSYLGFFILWIHSPRIMFNYHYLASTAFLTIAIGLTLDKLLSNKEWKILGISFLILMFSLFVYFYPLWTGIHVPVDFSNNYFWLQSWR